MTVERVFIVGGTGNIGKRCVQDLLDKQVSVTLYARQPEKVHALFPSDLVQVVQGDFSDLSALQEGINGHTRLFLLVSYCPEFVKIKTDIARYAFDAGIQQIVDISSFCVNFGWRFFVIGSDHYYAEKAIFDFPSRTHFVALRPGRFMSNHFGPDSPIRDGELLDTFDQAVGWISPEDIGAVAAVVLSESPEKHGDAVYNLTGDVLDPVQRAGVISRVGGKLVTHKKISAVEKYDAIMALGRIPHIMAVDLTDKVACAPDDLVTPIIEILLRRKPQTFEEYMTLNKSKLA